MAKKAATSDTLEMPELGAGEGEARGRIERDLARLGSLASDADQERADAFDRMMLAHLEAVGVSVDDVLREAPYRRAIAEAWRAMSRAYADEAAPLLAKLAARYRKEPADPIFRSLLRVISDVDASELEHMRLLVEAALVARATFAGRSSWDGTLELLASFSNDSRRARETIHWAPAYGEPQFVGDARGRRLSARSGVVAVMFRHGLLLEASGSAMSPVSAGPTTVRSVGELGRSALDVLRDLFGLPEPKPSPLSKEKAKPTR